MAEKKKTKKFSSDKRFSGKNLALFGALFAVVGGIFLLQSYADNPNLPGDINHDNVVNITDMSMLLSAYGTNNTEADLNDDGTVNVLDLSILLTNYGRTYTPTNPAPTLTFSANPTTINSGQSSTLTWSTTNATGCTASGAWSGTRSTAGSQAVSPTATSTYSLTCNGSGGSANRSVTVNVTTPNPPPNPPPPPPTSSNCLVSNASSWQPESCTAGTTIEVVNQTWSCNRALSQYGPLPVKVVVRATTTYNAAGAITLDAGCVGDASSDTVDLIGIIEGDGARGTRGVGQDAFKTRQTPRDVQVTGRFECGPQAPNAHQDMVQFQGGTNITLVNVTSGNWSTGRATCQGAGGIIYTDGGTNIDIVNSYFVGCNHGTIGGNRTQNEIRNSGSRSGRTDGSDPNCVGFSASPPCASGPLFVNVICERWQNGGWVRQTTPT